MYTCRGAHGGSSSEENKLLQVLILRFECYLSEVVLASRTCQSQMAAYHVNQVVIDLKYLKINQSSHFCLDCAI